MLFGEHAVIYNRPCLVTAIDQRIQVEVKPLGQNILLVKAPEVGVVSYRQPLSDLGRKKDVPKGVRFLETAVKNFFGQYQVESGLAVKTKSEFSSEFGFGSSSAVTVAVLKALSALFKVRQSKKDLFDLAYKSVLEVAGVGSGFDLAAAIWGGTIYFVTAGKTILPLRVKNLPLVVAYSGVKADTPTLVRQVAQLYQDHPKLVGRIFDDMALTTSEAKKALVEANFKRLGQLMNFNQGLLDTLGVNTLKLSSLIFAARKAGAWGAKLSGAGGGDCIVALASEKKKRGIIKAIKKAGGKFLKVKPNSQGVKIL